MALTVEKKYIESDSLWRILLSGDVDISSSIKLKENLNLLAKNLKLLQPNLKKELLKENMVLV